IGGGDAGCAEGEHRERRGPDRRLTRLGAKTVTVTDQEPLPAREAARERLVLEAVAKRREHRERPDPRRLDPAPGAVGLLALAHPALGDRDRVAAERREARRARACCLAPPDFAQVDGT